MFRLDVRHTAVGAALAVLTLGLAACAGSGSTSSGSSTSVGAKSKKADLPAQYQSGLVEAVTEGYPPYSFQTPGGALSGLEPALAKAIAGQLGTTIKIQPESFENELLGLGEGKYDFVPSVNVTAARMKTYEFVSYVKDGATFATPKSNPSLTSDPMSVCGHTVADEASDAALEAVQQFSRKCTAAGKPPITIKTYPQNTAATLAVQSGRAQYQVSYLSVLGAYLKTTAGKGWKLTGPQFDLVLVGDALPKGSPLGAYLAKAINTLIENGTYTKLLKASGFTSANAVSKAQVNARPLGA